MAIRTTGVTGFVLEGNYLRAATVVSDAGAYKVVDRATDVEIEIDSILTRWITQRAVSSACIRGGLKETLSLVRVDKIKTFLAQDKRAKAFSTEAFVQKMDPKHATEILEQLLGDVKGVTVAA